MAADVIPTEWRMSCYILFYSCAHGPLSWAAIVLFQGLVFHSVEKMTSLFIHILPTIVCLSLRMDPDTLQEQWPNRFPTQEEWDLVTGWDVTYPGIVWYFCWLGLHGAWLLTVGV